MHQPASPEERRMPEQPSQAVQDYLKAIHTLNGADRPVAPAEIAARLQVKPSSVTGMLKRLAESGWIDYEPGRGARLTETGIREARHVIRRHRLVELFLHRVLGLDWSEVDAEAEALEHAISPRLELAITAHLAQLGGGEPLEDPHGHLIPTREGAMAHRELRSLDTFRPGALVTIREVRDDSPERLRHWQSLGLMPGVCVLFVRHQPLDDLFEIQVAGRVVALGSEGLVGLLGEAVPPSVK
jgi:DtxR family Mn-dependent transcriptional regulator